MLRELFDPSGSEMPGPGAGSAAAVVIALAAGLVVKVARLSGGWPEAAGVSAQAVELRDRCPELARQDAEAWQQSLAALGDSVGGGGGDLELARLLGRAADLPLAIAETGAAVADLALLAVQRGEATLRGEAAAGAVLAHAGVRVAAHLVVLNLSTLPGDERFERAGRVERHAADAAAQAIATGD